MDLVEYNSSHINRHPWELARYEVIKHFIRKYKSPGVDLLILDIGCGDCFVSQKLLQLGMNITIVAIDPAYSPEEIGNKMQEINHPYFHLFRSINEGTGLLTKPVNFILLLDVLEHIENDTVMLNELSAKNFVDHDTKFIITVPAYQALFTSHDKFLLHYRRYSNRAIKRTIGACGLSSLSTGYFFFSLLPVRILQRLKEKIAGNPKRNYGIGGWTYRRAFTRFVKTWLLLDFKIARFIKKLGINLPGLSNYCICQKSAS